MEARLILSALRIRKQLRSHERWSEPELRAFQSARLRDLRRYALAHSAFYRRFHKGVETSPLADLPVLTKAELMANFDELVTARGVRLTDVERHLTHLQANERFHDRFWVTRTSGSTGNPGIFLVDRDEWATVIGSYARAQEWAGIRASVTRRTRLGVVSSRVPWHQSARVGMSVDSPFVPVRRFDATQPLSEIVAGLNAWQPENLVAYASMARLLADEQLAGRLRISPRAVMCSSEVLTPEAATRIERAWGAAPFNVYAATETAGVASECRNHRMHLYEDLVITEVVDERNQPLPPDTVGARVLVTVLFSRTQPLIRYEMSDRLSLSAERCGCGLPFALLAGITGRAEDSLTLHSPSGDEVVVHPVVFHRVLEPLPVREWQVDERADGLHVLLGKPVSPQAIPPTQLAETLTRALRHLGAAVPPIVVEFVDAVPRTQLGKAPQIKAMRRNRRRDS